jgi:uncharacterized protein
VTIAPGVRERSRPPNVAWPIVEIIIAVAIMIAGLAGYIDYSSVPWMLLVAWLFLWWRGPGWRGVGLRLPPQPLRTVLIGIALGVGYQFLGLYAVEPLIARMTSGEIPDVSMFRFLIHNPEGLAFYLALSWTLAAFMEEMVFRGYLMARVAELWRVSERGWIIAALITSVLFGAIHMYQGLSGMIATGLTGFVFAGAYLATGRNLWVSILAHGFMDTAGFVMMYYGVYPGV